MSPDSRNDRGAYFPYLDVLRVAAAISVAIAHGVMVCLLATHASLVAPAVLFAALGIEVIFVLSGFLMARALFEVVNGERTAMNVGLRRALRTLPLYYLFLIVHALLFATITPDRTPSLSFLTLSQALWHPAGTLFFAESWSLSVLVWFYALATLLAALCFYVQRRRNLLLGLMILLIIALPVARATLVLHHGWEWDAGLRKLTWFRIDALAVGVVAYHLSTRTLIRSVQAARIASWAMSFVCMALAAAALVHMAQVAAQGRYLAPVMDARTAYLGSAVFPALSIAIAWLIVKLARLECPRPGAWLRGARNVAQWSYALYLCHLPLLFVVLWLAGSPLTYSLAKSLGLIAAWLVLSLLVSALLFCYVEAPLLRWRERVLLKN